MGGIIIGYEMGRLLKKETIFCERVNGKFKIRRGFKIKKKSKVLIVEDVITTGKSSLECVKLIKKSKAKLVGFACIINRSNKKTLKIKNKTIISQLQIIDRSNKKNLKIKQKVIAHLKINVPTYSKNKLPTFLKSTPITKPGSRYIK